MSPQQHEEASKLRAEAMAYLKSRVGDKQLEGKEMAELFDSLVFYWSR
jgi:hypothetical protein